MGVQRQSKIYRRSKPAAKSSEQHAIARAARFKADQELHLAVQNIIEDIASLIDKTAEEFNKSYDEISNLVHLGGTVIKQ